MMSTKLCYNPCVCLMSIFVCLVLFKYQVIAFNNQDGFSAATMAETDVCSDLFNNQQCIFMQNVMKTVINKVEEEKLEFKRQLESEVSARKKEKFKFEKEKSIFFNQITNIRQEIKTVKLELKHKLNTKNSYTNDKKYSWRPTGQSQNDVDPLQSHYHNDYSWKNDVNDFGYENSSLTSVSMNAMLL